MKERLCLFCRHFTISSTEPEFYDPFSMVCSKNHWQFDDRDCSTEDFRKLMETGRECEDFEIGE